MIHLHRVLSAAVICLALAEFAGAQVSPPPIPQGLKKVGATIDGSAREKIQALVVAQFNRMVSPDAKADVQKVVREAREALAMEAKDGTQPASPEYQAAYAEAVAAQAKTAFAGAKDIRAKLNIAIVVAKVAESAPQTQLEPAVMMLLAEGESTAMHIWGLRASRFLMPELAKIGSTKNLCARIVAIVTANPNSSLTEEAYEVLKPTEDPKVLVAVVDPLLTIAEQRIAQLQAGFAEDPFLDYKALYGIAQSSTWNVITATQRVRAMQLMANIMTWGASRADEQKGTVRDQLGVLINKSAGALSVMASITEQTTTIAADKAAAGSLASVARSLSETSTGANVSYVKSCQPIVPAITAITEFAKVKVPDPAVVKP